MRRQTKTKAPGVDGNAISDLEAPQSGRGEIYDHVLDTTVLAGDDPAVAPARACHHASSISDAGVGEKGEIGAITGPDHLSIVIVE